MVLKSEKLRSARCLRVVLSKLLAARKANFLSLLVLTKKSQCSHARECSQRPFVTPITSQKFLKYPLWVRIVPISILHLSTVHNLPVLYKSKMGAINKCTESLFG